MKKENPNHITAILHFDFEGWCTRFTNRNVREIAMKVDQIYGKNMYIFAHDIFEQVHYIYF